MANDQEEDSATCGQATSGHGDLEKQICLIQPTVLFLIIFEVRFLGNFNLRLSCFSLRFVFMYVGFLIRVFVLLFLYLSVVFVKGGSDIHVLHEYAHIL